MTILEELKACEARKNKEFDDLVSCWLDEIKTTKRRNLVRPADFYQWVRARLSNEKEIHSELRKAFNRKVLTGELVKSVTDKQSFSLTNT